MPALVDPSISVGNVYLMRSRADENADQYFSTFLKGLRPNSLQKITIRGRFMKELSFKALATHSLSLKSVTVQLSPEALAALPELKDATLLETIQFEDDTPSNTYSVQFEEEAAQNITAWLSSCSRLRNLTIEKFLYGSKLVGAIMENRSIKLQELTVRLGNGFFDPSFYVGLKNHSTLTSLSITAPPDTFLEDTQAGSDFLESLCTLKNMHRLRLVDVSDYFLDGHICSLARSLKLLEELTVGGTLITDIVWDDLSDLKSLRLLGFTGLSVFTPEGIMQFIKKLSNNRGMQLEIMAARDVLQDIERKSLEREMIKKGGTFIFAPWRGERASEIVCGVKC